jgi:stage V sporulation protein D (sporulation-specific penicillin-binding protein)
MDNPGESAVIPNGRARALWLLVIFILIFILLAIRLVYLQLIEHQFFLNRSLEQRIRIITLSPDRGDICDRNGNVLATSISAFSVGAFPSDIKNKPGTADLLSKILKEKRSGILQKLNSGKPFVWIVRKIEEPLARKIKDKNISGIELLPEKKRVYPKNKLAAQIIGFVGMDNQGMSGIEISYDKYLKGEEGKLIKEIDPRGREILTSSLRVLKSPTNGGDITLTIDEPIQYKAETEIKKMVESSHANSGSVIVMDVRSGEILALASYPSFDPNDYQKYNKNVWYNRVVTDVYEPGSTFKLVTVASALEEGVISKETVVYCPDTIKLGGRTIRNSHHLKFDTHYLSIKEILRESVNTGAVQIALMMGKEKFYKHIKDFGFGDYTGVGLFGESRGILNDPSTWNKPDIAMMSFGQSIAVTPIQLLSSLTAIVNGGVMIKPRLVKKIEKDDANFVKVFAPEDRGRAISGKVASDMVELCEDVVENGTGHNAKIAGFRVGGKTGTAQKPLPGGGGYMAGRYVSSFIGFAPLDKPCLAILVVVDDPKPVYWGEKIAAPVFKEVAEYALRRQNISPDKKESSVKESSVI